MQEYAKMAGISLAGAYKRINGRLKERIIKIENKTYINVSNLDLLLPEEEQEEIQVEDADPLTPDKSDNSGDLLEILQEKDGIINTLQATITGQDTLIQSLRQQIDGMQSQYQAQLAAKDETISTLQGQVQSQQTQLDKLAELLHQSQQMQIGQLVAVQQSKPSLWQRIFHRR